MRTIKLTSVPKTTIEAAREHTPPRNTAPRIGATILEGTPAYFRSLAKHLRRAADEHERGGNLDDEQRKTFSANTFRKAGARRVADSLRRWADRCEKAAE